MANGGEERVKSIIGTMLEEAEESEISFTVKGIGLLALSTEQPGLSSGRTIYLARMDRKFTEEGEKRVEEVFWNFAVVKEDDKYKIEDFWD